MAANLVSLIMQSVTPGMISKVASALDLDPVKTQKAIGVSIPAILASFASVASKPEGGQQLSDAMAEQSGILDQLKSVAGAGREKALVENGQNFLSSLLGGNALNALSGAVSRFAGVDANASKSLLGMLGPIVAGVVGQRTAGMDPKGLASLLTSQKDQITAAMPPGFSNLLGSVGLLDGLGDSWRSGVAAASSAADRVTDISGHAAASAGEMAQAARGASSSLPYWALGLAALAGLGWFAFGQRDAQTVAERPAAAAIAFDSESLQSESMKTGRSAASSDLTVAVASSMDSIKSTLDGIVDPTSARVALPKLQQATTQIDRITSAASLLAPDSRKQVSSLVGQSMPALNRLFDRIMASPQTAQLAKPAIDTLRARLDALSRS